MKTLYLLRHAQAEIAPMGANDHARPLTALGRMQAMQVGGFMKNHNMVPDIVLASDSRRTLETAEAVLRRIGTDTPLHTDPHLYNASMQTLMSDIHSTSDGFESIMYIVHNPGVGEIAYHLHGDKDEIFPGFSPATLAVFKSNAESWGLVSADNILLEHLYAP